MSTRSAVRKKLVELIAQNTLAEDRVYSNRARSVWPEELPLIAVYTRTENCSEFSKAPRTIKRELLVAVECIAKADDSLDDTLDQMAEEVEAAIGSDESLGELCSDVLLQDTEMTLSGDGNTLYGSAILTYRVTYFSELVEPEAVGDQLEGFDVTYDLKPSELVEAEDKIDVPTS